MTTTPNDGVPRTESQSWGSIATGFAYEIAREDFRRGDLAELRRMNPDAPDTTAFWRLMAQKQLLGNAVVESKWALILQGIALMTSTASSRSAHDGTIPVGRALFYGGDSDRTRAYYSENRLNRLLVARGPMMRSLLARMFRMMGSTGQPFDWREMARLILNDGYNEERAENVRRRIARSYYMAEMQSERKSSDASNK